MMVRKGMGPFKRITTGGGATAKKVSTAAAGGDYSTATQSRKSTRSAK